MIEREIPVPEWELYHIFVAGATIFVKFAVQLVPSADIINLSCNGSVFVKEGLGYMLTFDKLIKTDSESGLCFRPLEPVLETKM